MNASRPEAALSQAFFIGESENKQLTTNVDVDRLME